MNVKYKQKAGEVNTGPSARYDPLIDLIEERNLLLKNLPYQTVRKAWFTLSHLLLDDGARILDMGCGDGEMTFAMAGLNPKVKFIGIDKNTRKINKAKQTYKTHNLDYKVGDISSDLFEKESIDAIINSYTLHEVFSNSLYNERMVRHALRNQFAMLKNDGQIYIQDYAKPPAGQFVLMEMHDEESRSNNLSDLSDADLLVWYSQHARPKQDPGCGGFFLEELPPRFPRTRLFRLPYKWAYEFIMRKDKRQEWERELPFEYTFYTISEFQNQLQSLGARVQYSAPHWDDDLISKNFQGKFRLFEDNGNPMGDPSTSFIALARKLPERNSLRIEERRLTNETAGTLEIKAMRDQKNGQVIDIVTRHQEVAEIIPYRISEEGRLNVFLHDGIARGLTNAVMRGGMNIDGKQWSGHMVEPIATDYCNMPQSSEITPARTIEFADEMLSLKPRKDAHLEEGAKYYPDPNTIDERVHTYYLHVESHEGHITPRRKTIQTRNFQTRGVIRELSAQSVLDAITVGLIPSGRLELQILALFQRLNMKAENWIRKDIALAAGEIISSFNLRDFMRQKRDNDIRFREVKGTAGQLRTINSVFVEEGQNNGGTIGMSAENIPFVISDENTVNTAIVLPLTRSMKNDIHAGFLVKHLPVPQRYEGTTISISAPQFNIPREITNYKLLKQFIAEKFGVTPEMVFKLGESYYTHIGMTPQRIHPFAIAAPPDYIKNPDTQFMPLYQFMLFFKTLTREPHFMIAVARAYRFLPYHMRMQANHDIKILLEERFRGAQPDWSMPVTIEADSIKASNLEKESKSEKAKRLEPEKFSRSKPDLDLLTEFDREINTIKSLIEQQENEKKPKPEKW